MDELFEQDDVRKRFVPSRDVGTFASETINVSGNADIDKKKSSSIEHVETV